MLVTPLPGESIASPSHATAVGLFGWAAPTLECAITEPSESTTELWMSSSLPAAARAAFNLAVESQAITTPRAPFTNSIGAANGTVRACPPWPAAGVPTYTATLHGNGFWNSGFLDGDDATPLPSSTQVRFGSAGTFAYICLIHPFMRAEVTVTP